MTDSTSPLSETPKLMTAEDRRPHSGNGNHRVPHSGKPNPLIKKIGQLERSQSALREELEQVKEVVLKTSEENTAVLMEVLRNLESLELVGNTTENQIELIERKIMEKNDQQDVQKNEPQMKSMPRWMKLGLGLTAAGATAGTAYAVGKYHGKKQMLKALDQNQ